MNTKELKKIEMKNDGHDRERFQSMLKTIVSVPKEELKKEEEREKAKRVQSDTTDAKR